MTTGPSNARARFMSFRGHPVAVARRLLGQRLVRVDRTGRRAGTIVEVEAYLGADDKAAHTYGGRRTARNEVMYAAAGHAYIYLVYGAHHCLNVVCGDVGDGVAVLIRALEPTEGQRRMRTRRPKAVRLRDLCSGPGKLAQSMSIDRSMNGIDLRTSRELFIERLRTRPLPGPSISRSRRIGVAYAEEWADRPYRLFIVGNPHVSR